MFTDLSCENKSCVRLTVMLGDLEFAKFNAFAYEKLNRLGFAVRKRQFVP